MHTKLTQTSGPYSTERPAFLIPHITQGSNEERVFSGNEIGQDVEGIKG